MLPRVSNFFCFQLRTGALVIGLAQMIYATFGILGTILILADRKDFPNDKSDLVLDHLSVTIICLIVFICVFVIGCMLLRGVTKDKPNLMRPWIAVQASGVALLLFATLFYVICFWIFVFKGENVEAIIAMIVSDAFHLGNSGFSFLLNIN